VFNGQDYLAETLDSILAQTYTDFDLIISDNGSTDRTAAIVQAYAAKDPRIRSYRNESNLGAGWNFNRTFHLSSGEYFKWAAHDDQLEPAFLEKCVEALDRKPAVVLCFSKMVEIDAQGRELEVRGAGTRTYLDRASDRFEALIVGKHRCEEVFGLVRAEVLRKTRLIENYTDSDRTLLAELCLYGPFHEIPEVLFRHRLHSQSSVVANPSPQQRAAWFDPQLAGRLVLPGWQQLFALLSVIVHGPLSWPERARCGYHLLPWLKRRRGSLKGDFVRACQWLMACRLQPTAK